MRIVHDFNLGHYKCTLFFYQEKYQLKIEDEFGEVHYKLGTLDQLNVDDLPKLLQLPTIKKALKDAFLGMRTGRDLLKGILTGEDESDEEEII